jgi:hypothetical protein
MILNEATGMISGMQVDNKRSNMKLPTKALFSE